MSIPVKAQEYKQEEQRPSQFIHGINVNHISHIARQKTYGQSNQCIVHLSSSKEVRVGCYEGPVDKVRETLVKQVDARLADIARYDARVKAKMMSELILEAMYRPGGVGAIASENHFNEAIKS